MANDFKQKQRDEAIKRMKALGLHHNAIKEFKDYGKLNLSEGIGALYWLNDEQEKVVKEFEETTGNLVYHVIHNFTEFGELLSMLIVSKYAEEWDMDMDDIQNGVAFSYVKNLTNEHFSEYGGIGIRQNIGGLVRIS